MTNTDIGAYVFLGVVGLLLLAAIATNLYWGISTHLTWATRVRRLLEREGFTVRRMERRWFTKGPFQDMRLPGSKHHKEWLIRLVAVDREHRPRAGWGRWRRALPWEAADRWAVQWDEAPWTGAWDGTGDPEKRGLSSRVFIPLVLVPSLAGMVAGVSLLVRGFEWNRPASTSAAPDQTSPVSAGGATAQVQPDGYEIRCRGGEGTFRLQQLSGGPRSEATGEVWVALMSLEFRAGPLAAGVDASGLAPGTCAWIDRPLNDLEPRSIRFEAPAIHTTTIPHTIFPAPGLSPDAEYLRDSSRYWSFFVFNTNQGFLQATRHGPWNQSKVTGASS